MADLSRKRDRDRLRPRREPYWQRLAGGAYLGFRRGPDTWVARFRGRDEKQQYQSLGEGLEFDEAKERAERWLSQLSGSSVRSVKRGTVASALNAYVEDLRRHGRAQAADKAEGQFRTALGFDKTAEVYTDPIASLQLEDATQDDFLDWRDRLRSARLPRTVNRYVRALTAGLNRAHRMGHVGYPAAWRMEALPDNDEADTAVFLSPLQRKGLIDAASRETALFLRGLEFSGARPKELAEAAVSDFDGQCIKLSHQKGRPPKLRSRYVVLDQDGVMFFKSQAKDKTPAAKVFTTDDGKPWRRDLWAQEVRSAIASHNRTARGSARIPTEASAYSFRHARISELLQVYGVDPLTVAAQTGTSLRMIERAYFKFIRSAMLEKLANLKTKSVTQLY
ncbi:MAG: tyrosine-type recombinase/integrase [Steroidobacteraceae bacterium]